MAPVATNASAGAWHGAYPLNVAIIAQFGGNHAALLMDLMDLGAS